MAPYSEKAHCVMAALGSQQRLDGAALVHSPVSLRHLIKRKNEIEDLTRIDLSFSHRVDEIGQISTHGSGTAMKMDEMKEHRKHVQFHSVGHTDVPGRSAGARGESR